jgi:outer membrane protein, heavy metal efflux system
MNTTFQAMLKPHALKPVTKTAILCVLVAALFSACAKEKYQAKPINPQQASAKIFAKDPLSADFKVYLIKQGYKESELPFASWGLNELTSSALYHHPKLDVAKAQLALANAQLETAGQKQNPTLNGSLARSNQANGDIRPWSYGLNVEIPIETAGKRQIKIEEAQHLAQVARIDVAGVAWQLRSQLAKSLFRYHENIARQKLLQQDADKHTEITRMLEKRVALGALSNTELSSAKLLQQKNQFSLEAEQAINQEIIASLATDAGLSLEKFKQIPVSSLDIESALNKQAAALKPDALKNLQEKALLNRLDIRRGLEKYAAAEAKIMLEVAKQTPDISITPGFIFDFGDKIWSLGFSSLLNLLNKNQTLIAEATQLREIEGAQFEALQAKVIGDLSQTNARFVAAQQNLAAAKQQQSAQQVHMQKLNKQFAAGALDRLDLSQAALLAQLADAQVTQSQFDTLNAANEMEDLLQIPLDNNLNIIKP